jgi:hypothetical protein
VSVNAFLALLVIAVVLLRAGLGQGVDGYIVEYRANLGLSAFQKGSILSIISFTFFALLVLGMNVLLSMRIYHLRRALSIAVLASGILILLLAVIVSNSLLALY